MKGLIVTADDFGAAVEVNEAVENAHRDGLLTAASLMVAAPASADAVVRARSLPALRVGLHLVLTDGRPILPSRAVPDLVGRDGRFRENMALAGATMFFSARAREQLAHEIAAQFEAFAATGLKLDHANAHKHFHLHPTIAKLMVEIGARFGLRGVRVPLEPARVVRAIEGRGPASPINPLAPFCLMLRARLRSAGMMSPDRVFGLAWSGAMTTQRLRAVVAQLPEGVSEVYLHPATSSDFREAVPDYRYREELDALLDAAVNKEARGGGIKLGGFADFPARR